MICNRSACWPVAGVHYVVVNW